MIRNYILTAFRLFIRQWGYSLINILGITIGLACFASIMIYVDYHFSFDKQFTHSERIFRVTGDMTWANGIEQHTALSPPNIAGFLHSDFPEIESVVRLTGTGQVLLESDDNKFFEESFFIADSGFFEIFNQDLILGNSKEALSTPGSIVLSEDMVNKYFGNENPLGKTIRQNGKQEWTVKGVMKNFKSSSHFAPDFIASSVSQVLFEKNSWTSIQLRTYIKLKDGVNEQDFEQKMRDVFKEKYSRVNEILKFRLQPLEDIHLHNDRSYDNSNTANIKQLYILSIVALLILIVACINYTNLSTARSIRRAKEIGIRKLVGAHKRNLLKQLLLESFFMGLIGFFFSIVLIESVLPGFNRILDTSIRMNYSENIIPLLLLTILVSVTSGLYPALTISAFNPLEVLKGNVKIKGTRIPIRKFLVIFQFTMAISLMIAAGVIISQINMMRNMDTGFDKNRLISLWVWNEDRMNDIPILKSELEQLSFVEGVTQSNSLFGTYMASDNYIPEGHESHMPVYTFITDKDFIKTVGLDLIEGRDFSDIYPGDSLCVIVNEAAIKEFGWKDAIDKEVVWSIYVNNTKGKVIGLVKDFNFLGFDSEIEPLIIRVDSKPQHQVFLRINESISKKAAIQEIENCWNRFDPIFPMEPIFIDDEFKTLYKEEVQLNKIMGWFTLMIIMVACLGLFGLSSFMAENKKKEIGIRKVCGAGERELIMSFSVHFSRWVLIASVFAVPLAYFFMARWLNNFTYRVNQGLFIYIAAIGLSLIIAVLTTAYNAWRASNTNPVDVINHE